MLVIDIDGEQGEQSWLAVQTRAGFRLRETLSVHTGSGGRHLYLRTAVELGNSVGKLDRIDSRCEAASSSPRQAAIRPADSTNGFAANR